MGLYASYRHILAAEAREAAPTMVETPAQQIKLQENTVSLEAMLLRKLVDSRGRESFEKVVSFHVAGIR